ncbi:MAG TPA: OmpH family outer membrane protein [Blastocatellia bacterium]|nr:OmpH family outer membrane protein [Blastocatellia bacterium]
MKKILLTVAILSLFAVAALAQTPRPAGGAPAAPAQPTGGTGAEGKIAIINSSLFESDIAELKVKLEALSAELDPKRKEIETEQNEYNRIKNDIQTKGGTVTAQVRDQWVEQATELEKRIKRKAEDYEALAQKRLGESTQATYGKISEALSKYASSKGIAVVIDGVVAQQQRFLLWALPTTDITADFIKEYNAKNPAPASAAPAKK